MLKKSMTIMLAMILVLNIFGLHVSAMESDIDKLSDYEEVIDRINAEYGRNFEIKDTEAFKNYIVAKVSVEEFEQNLIKDANDFSQMKSENIEVSYNDNFTEIDSQSRISIVYERKHAFVTAPR